MLLRSDSNRWAIRPKTTRRQVWSISCVHMEGCTNKQDEGHRKCPGLEVRHVQATTPKTTKGHTHTHTSKRGLRLQTACVHSTFRRSLSFSLLALTLSNCMGPCSAYMHTHAFLLVLVLLTALPEPPSQLVITTLPPRSSPAL